MKYDHAAYRLNEKYFDIFVEMLKERLGFQELLRTKISVFLRQPGANVDLQFCRAAAPTLDEGRILSQVAFLSETPEAELTAIMKWAQSHGLNAKVVAYHEKAYYLDIPEVLVGFVMEAMLPECANYGERFKVR